MNKKNLRLGLLLPLSIICNCIILVTAVLEFYQDIFCREGGTRHLESSVSTTSFLRYTVIQPNEITLQFFSLLAFGLVLTVDTFFILIALCEEGKKKLPVIGGALLHHVGALSWIVMILRGNLPYCTGICFGVFLLEFCFPLRILVNLIYQGESSRKSKSSSGKISAKTQWLFRIFMVDMFMSGGGTFVALLIYLLIISDKSLNPEMRSKFFYTYLSVILYWFLQLATFHRASQDRLVQKAVSEATTEYKRLEVEDTAEFSEILFDSSSSDNDRNGDVI